MAFGGLKGTLSGNGNSITASNSIAGSVAVNVGDLVFAVISEQTSLTATTAGDNLGNTYAAQNAGTLNSTILSGRAYWSRITVAGTLTSVAIVATASAHDWAGFAAILEGPFDLSPVDTNAANITSDITSPFTCPATGTLARANEAVLCWGAANESTVWAATSPNLLAGNVNNSINVKVAIGYQATSATTTVTPNFTAAANPTNNILGTISFKGIPTYPNSWQRSDIAAIAVWPLALLLTQPTQVFVPPVVGSIGWQQPFPFTPPIRTAIQTQPTQIFVPSVQQAMLAIPLVQNANPPATLNVYYQASVNPLSPPAQAVTQQPSGWQSQLPAAVSVAQAQQGYNFVPFKQAKPPQGWQSTASTAPPVAKINAPPLTFVVPPFAVPKGWQQQPLQAPSPINAIPTQPTQVWLPVTAQVITPVAGWYMQLSAAVPNPQPQLGAFFVPFDTKQVAPAPTIAIDPFVWRKQQKRIKDLALARLGQERAEDRSKAIKREKLRNLVLGIAESADEVLTVAEQTAADIPEPLTASLNALANATNNRELERLAQKTDQLITAFHKYIKDMQDIRDLEDEDEMIIAEIL